jgi:bifunctional DNA-binding transcriptional regulator/antitoxin component of YhaV-PrlF toxin-antitoxin module
MTNVMYDVEVTAEGNLILPPELRASLGLQAGDTPVGTDGRSPAAI